MKGETLQEPSVKEWSAKLATVHPFLNEYTPFSAHLEYFRGDGRKETVSHSWKLGKIYDWKRFEMELEVPEEGYAPRIRMEAMPEYAGVIYLDRIGFEKIK